MRLARFAARMWLKSLKNMPCLLCQQASAPVWRQLDELCDKSPLVAPLRLQRLREDMQQLQGGLDMQKQTINQLLEKVEQLSRENADLRIR